LQSDGEGAVGSVHPMEKFPEQITARVESISQTTPAVYKLGTRITKSKETLLLSFALCSWLYPDKQTDAVTNTNP